VGFDVRWTFLTGASICRCFPGGGGERIRTAILPRARRALSQLELRPQMGFGTSLYLRLADDPWPTEPDGMETPRKPQSIIGPSL
jgi:hypothetical protein